MLPILNLVSRWMFLIKNKAPKKLQFFKGQDNKKFNFQINLKILRLAKTPNS